MKYLFWNELLFIVSLLRIDAFVSAFTTPKDCKRISPSIVVDLSDFTQLIDKVVFGEIVAKHLILDNGFRRAFEYVKTQDFLHTIDELQNVPEVQEVLEFLQILVPCSDSAFYVPELEIVLLQAFPHTENYRYVRQKRTVVNNQAASVYLSSLDKFCSFTSFVREVINQMPRSHFRDLIMAKSNKSNEFKTFYKALKSDSFKPKIESAQQSSNAAPYIKKLSSHDIDVKELLPIFFEVLSWGPDL